MDTESRRQLLNLFPLPTRAPIRPEGISTTTLPDRAGLATQRPGAARGLERRAEDDVVHAAAVRLREACRRRIVPGIDRRRLAAEPSKYEIDTVSYVNTLLHTFSRRMFAEAPVGVNWAHQYTSPLDQAAQDANDRTKVLPGLPQFFPEANPLNSMPQASFAGGPPGSVASFNVESAVAVLRVQHALEFLRQPHQARGVAQYQDGAIRRAHDAARGSARLPSTDR